MFVSAHTLPTTNTKWILQWIHWDFNGDQFWCENILAHLVISSIKNTYRCMDNVSLFYSCFFFLPSQITISRKRISSMVRKERKSNTNEIWAKNFSSLLSNWFSLWPNSISTFPCNEILYLCCVFVFTSNYSFNYFCKYLPSKLVVMPLVSNGTFCGVWEKYRVRDFLDGALYTFVNNHQFWFTLSRRLPID